MIYISTGGFNFQTGISSAEELLDNGINAVELSGGLYSSTIEQDVLSISNKLKLQIHNYFPPPSEPFVFNLASSNNGVIENSTRLAQEAIQLCSKLGCEFYSFHAGFLFDPDVSRLGKKFGTEKLQNREFGLGVFIERVNDLSLFAKEFGVSLLIENNVFSHSNSKVFDENPFLMSDHKESLYVIENTPENVSLLVDVGHLKVSSKTLSFCKVDFLNQTKDYTLAYHLSENDGLSDSNKPITNDSWFWPYIRKDLNYYSLEIYKQSFAELILQLELTKNQLSS